MNKRYVLLVLFVLGLVSVSGIVSANILLKSSNPNMAINMCDRVGLFNDLPANGGTPLLVRVYNFMYEGEVFYWKVLALHTEGIDNVEDVYVTRGNSYLPGENDKVMSCSLSAQPQEGEEIYNCNARIGETHYDYFNSSIMNMYDCYYVGEDEETVHGGYYLGIEANDSFGAIEKMEEDSYFFLNPHFNLSQNEVLQIGNAFSGQTVYSNLIQINQEYEQGSGAIYSFIEISGTNIYNSHGKPIMCEGKEFLSVDNIYYYAENGQYNTTLNPNADEEGYVQLSETSKPIIGDFDDLYQYYVYNINLPNGVTKLKLKVDVPLSCRGQFNSGYVNVFARDPDNFNQSFTLSIPINFTVKKNIQQGDLAAALSPNSTMVINANSTIYNS